jgi:hypothetical protein
VTSLSYGARFHTRAAPSVRTASRTPSGACTRLYTSRGADSLVTSIVRGECRPHRIRIERERVAKKPRVDVPDPDAARAHHRNALVALRERVAHIEPALGTVSATQLDIGNAGLERVKNALSWLSAASDPLAVVREEDIEPRRITRRWQVPLHGTIATPNVDGAALVDGTDERSIVIPPHGSNASDDERVRVRHFAREHPWRIRAIPQIHLSLLRPDRDQCSIG